MHSFHLLSLALSLVLSCSPGHAQHSYGHEKPRPRHRNANKMYSTFDARDANVAFTYFNDGQGACGTTNSPSDFIVALNSAEYGGGAHCFEWITITINGQTAQAQITDECPGCAIGGLDFSSGLFTYFAPLSEGELYGSWSYNSDIATSTSTPPPTTTSTPSWTPTTTASSSSKAWPTTTTTSLTSTVIPSPTSTTTTTTVPTSTPQDPQMITQINFALLELGGLLQASLKLET